MQKSVDFITDSADVQHAWVVAVQYLLENIRKEALHFNEEKYVANVSLLFFHPIPRCAH